MAGARKGWIGPGCWTALVGPAGDGLVRWGMVVPMEVEGQEGLGVEAGADRIILGQPN